MVNGVGVDPDHGRGGGRTGSPPRSPHELGIQPEAYDPKLDVDFTPLREQDLSTAGFGTAA
ncbi:hypothetical protein [Streptosporangium sp. NPDC087985]|uniref:hypothetical protein n=1 Tax=Streptosporangium sp. NPDC087985 TaxID=3366196 RepID=UPI0037FDEDEE